MELKFMNVKEETKRIMKDKTLILTTEERNARYEMLEHQHMLISCFHHFRWKKFSVLEMQIKLVKDVFERTEKECSKILHFDEFNRLSNLSGIDLSMSALSRSQTFSKTSQTKPTNVNKTGLQSLAVIQTFEDGLDDVFDSVFEHY
jgi:hypothetical protein